MMTGRVLAQYNACAMTGRTEGLGALSGSSFIELNDADAAALGIADGDRVRVTSRRGSLETTASVSDKTNPGQTWMPFHFQDGNSNWLTIAALDPVSKAPEYKVCAVRVEKA
ncbi:MAG: molybdopterin dinucleotide binding domain-containing protein, partial [Gordonibacter urolithinfaciens]